MVLATKVGKERPFWRGFWLTVVTFGLYGIYWNYRAHDELFRQFELSRETRSEAVEWYVLGFAIPVLDFPYYYQFAANIQYLRLRMGRAQGLTPGGFLALVIPAAAGLLVLGFAALIVAGAGMDEAGNIVDQGLFTLGIILGLVGFVQWVILRAIAYAKLQGDVNWVWQVYDARAQQLRSPPMPFPAASAASAR